MQLRIFGITEDMPYVAGGRYAFLKLFENLSSFVDTDLVVGSGSTIELFSKKKMKITHIRTPFSKHRLRFTAHLRMFIFSIQALLVSLLKGKAYSVVFSNYGYGSIIAYIAARLLNKPLAILVHDTPWYGDEDYPEGLLAVFTLLKKQYAVPFISKIFSWLVHLLNLSIIKQAAFVFAVSKFTKRNLKRWRSPKEVLIAENGIELTNYKSNVSTDKFPLILSINRFVATKRPYDLVKMLDILTKEFGINARLVMIGAGPLLNNVKHLVHRLNLMDRVQILSNVSEKEKVTWLNRCWMVVSTSELEGFGMSPMEAFACQKPVITYDLDVFKMVYNTHILFAEKGNVRDLTSKVKQLIENPKLRIILGERGYKFVKNKSWRRTARHVINKFLIDLSCQRR